MTAMQPSDQATNPAGDFLVIGYGNTLRRDAGVGPRVAEAVEELHLPNVARSFASNFHPNMPTRFRAPTWLCSLTPPWTRRTKSSYANLNPTIPRNSWRTPPTRARCSRWHAMFSVTH